MKGHAFVSGASRVSSHNYNSSSCFCIHLLPYATNSTSRGYSVHLGLTGICRCHAVSQVKHMGPSVSCNTIWTICDSFAFCLRNRLSSPSKNCVSRSDASRELEFRKSKSPTYEWASRIGYLHESSKSVVIGPFDELKSFDALSQHHYSAHD